MCPVLSLWFRLSLVDDSGNSVIQRLVGDTIDSHRPRLQQFRLKNEQRDRAIRTSPSRSCPLSLQEHGLKGCGRRARVKLILNCWLSTLCCGLWGGWGLEGLNLNPEKPSLLPILHNYCRRKILTISLYCSNNNSFTNIPAFIENVAGLGGKKERSMVCCRFQREPSNPTNNYYSIIIYDHTYRQILDDLSIPVLYLRFHHNYEPS